MTRQTKTVLLVGGAAALVYLLTRQRATPVMQPLPPAYLYQQPTSGPGFNPQIITAAAGAINTLIPALTSLFGGKPAAAPATQSPSYYV